MNTKEIKSVIDKFDPEIHISMELIIRSPITGNIFRVYHYEPDSMNHVIKTTRKKDIVGVSLVR